jgi:septum formation protein
MHSKKPDLGWEYMLILASASPRRRDLLNQIALPHTVRPAHIDEARLPGEDPVAYVRRLALEKASSIARSEPEATILGADTTVVLGEEILNKPADLAEGKRMLRALAGRTHYVHTGIAVVHASRAASHVETTAVSFTGIPEPELAAYLATGDSLDKAGAYGIQGYAARWIARIEGDFFNVVGLPLAATLDLLRKAGALAT